MCRDTLSVGWMGEIFDCDFNQMLEMQMRNEAAGVDLVLATGCEAGGHRPSFLQPVHRRNLWPQNRATAVPVSKPRLVSVGSQRNCQLRTPRHHRRLSDHRHVLAVDPAGARIVHPRSFFHPTPRNHAGLACLGAVAGSDTGQTQSIGARPGAAGVWMAANGR